MDADFRSVERHADQLSLKSHQVLLLDVLGVVFDVEAEVKVVLRVNFEITDPSSRLPQNLVHARLHLFVFLLREVDVEDLALLKEVLHQILAVRIPEQKRRLIFNPLWGVCHFRVERVRQLISSKGGNASSKFTYGLTSDRGLIWACALPK